LLLPRGLAQTLNTQLVETLMCGDAAGRSHMPLLHSAQYVVLPGISADPELIHEAFVTHATN